MSRASSATPSAPRRSSTGCCGAMAFRRCRSGPAASSCAARGDDAPLRTVEVGRDPVHGAAGVHGNPPCRQRRRRLSRTSADLTEVALQVCVALAMAIGLERLRIRTGSIVHNAGAILLTVFAGLAIGGRAVAAGEPDAPTDRCRRRRSSTCCCSAMRCPRCWRCCCPMPSPAAARQPMPTPSRRARWFWRWPM